MPWLSRCKEPRLQEMRQGIIQAIRTDRLMMEPVSPAQLLMAKASTAGVL
jgi:hypothetical protein